jgi:hypothetical protein
MSKMKKKFYLNLDNQFLNRYFFSSSRCAAASRRRQRRIGAQTLKLGTKVQRKLQVLNE